MSEPQDVRRMASEAASALAIKWPQVSFVDYVANLDGSINGLPVCQRHCYDQPVSELISKISEARPDGPRFSARLYMPEGWRGALANAGGWCVRALKDQSSDAGRLDVLFA